MDSIYGQPVLSRSLEVGEEDEPGPKRLKTSHDGASETKSQSSHLAATAVSGTTRYDVSGLLPPSLCLLGVDQTKTPDAANPITREIDVGISEYISSSAGRMEGIIKQRFTDFLVFEVDKAGNVLHITSLDPPAALDIPSKPPPAPEPTVNDEQKNFDPPLTSDQNSWTESINSRLEPFLSSEAIDQLKEMYFQGPEPPQPASAEDAAKSLDSAGASQIITNEQGRGRGRGGRGGRGRGGGRGGTRVEDRRRVTSELITSKEKRTELHGTIREVFGGKLDTEAVEATGETGSRIVIKWMSRGRGRGARGGRDNGGRQSTETRRPPYIHFTLQKTNRDTQDALSIVARALKREVKDLSVAGTKDKRGVTTQRVSLKRGHFTIADVWKAINVQRSRERSMEHALKERGERGVRIGELEYQPSFLELGMLKGNAFVITLRNVKVDSVSIIDEVMESIKTKGFINYYGMQRFGTSAIPTHAIGLAILKSDWTLAVSLLLRPRPGENPDSEDGRRAWLEHGNLRRALQLIPRRSVAERCILESYQKQKGEGRNAYGALSTIPRNLRLMYVHAYQSYVWNALVSERIRRHGCDKPVVGDLVFQQEEPEVVDDLSGADGAPEGAGTADELTGAADTDAAATEVAEPQPEDGKMPDAPKHTRQGGKKVFVAPKVKILEESDLPKYSIFDVIMPLPGRDVSYPGGELGERFRAFLRADGLDPDNLNHTQRDYTLLGSYRKILHLPAQLSWSVLRYTDPEVPLAQSDEDKILGFDEPRTDPDGKFMALQMNLQLGTAAYATMAIREITKMDTSAQSQSLLTQASEDQAYKGSGANVESSVDAGLKMEVET